MITIYKITNRLDGKAYIGQTSLPLAVRWATHISKAKTCSELNHLHFYRAIRRDGVEQFDQEILCEVSNELADAAETGFIAACKTFSPELGYGYNMTPGGHGTGRGKSHPLYGKHHSYEAREKNRQSHLGKNEWWTPERRKTMGERVRKNNPSVSDCAPFAQVIEQLANQSYKATDILKVLVAQGFTSSYESLRHYLVRSGYKLTRGKRAAFSAA